MGIELQENVIYNNKFHNRRIGRPYYQLMGKACLSTLKWAKLKEYKSVLDIGCSCGALLAQIDIPVKYGIDFGVSRDTFVKEAGMYVEHDLSTGHINLSIGFDLITCLEVAEHLPLTSSSVIDTISCNANSNCTLIFSAAKPNQRGRNHINCQPSWYWLEKLTLAGFKYNAPMNNNYIAEIGNDIPECYRSNTMILTYGENLK